MNEYKYITQISDYNYAWFYILHIYTIIELQNNILYNGRTYIDF